MTERKRLIILIAILVFQIAFIIFTQVVYEQAFSGLN